MADPRIKYDVVANAEGEEDVRRLADALDKVDEAIDPAAAEKARRVAQELRNLGQQKDAIDTFRQLKSQTEEARAALDQAQAAAQKLGRELSTTEKPTRVQAGQMEKLRDAVKSARTEFQAKTQQLGTARGALAQMGVASDELARAEIRVRTATAATRNEAIQLAAAYQTAASTAVASGATQVRAQTQVQGALQGLNDTYRRLQSVAAVAIGGGIFGSLIKDVAATADEFKNLQARVKLVTGEGAAFNTAWQGVEEIANRTNTRLETTGTLFARIAAAGKDIGLSQRDALQLTETINQAIQVSGGSAQAADAAITQLIQGLQGGVLRGEEFNSVVEQSPRLAKALADGLGVASGELRKLANAGELTADVVIKALQSQADAVSTEFGKLPPTVGRALTTLSNNWTTYVGEVDKANGVSEKAAEVILLLAENLETVGNALIIAGKAVAAYKALQLAQSLLATATAARASALAKAQDTLATQANTAALQANTLARAANATASAVSTAATSASAAAGAAATTGLLARGAMLLRFAGIAGLVISSVVTIGSLLVDVFGPKAKRIDDATDSLKDNASAAKDSAESHDELAASTDTAAAASSNLSKEAKRIVDDFGSIQRKSSQAGEAVAKLAQSLDLGNIEGITDALTALDELERRGKITGNELRKAIGGALKDLDLGTFKTNALAAFDGSEQGARRLQAALDAIADESLRRVNTSVDELRSGFSAAATKAINDLDQLAETLDDLGADATTSGRLLGQALSKATDAADTEKAVEAVIERLKALGQQGKLSGQQLTEGLDAARKKLDEMKPGIDSVAEAYRNFGLKTKAELQAVADRNRAAWLQIKNDATASITTKQQAFKQYAESAIAANGGVASSNLKVEAASQRVAIQVDKTGQATVKSMGEASDAVEKTAKRFNELGQEINQYGDAINQLAGNIGGAVKGVRGPDGIKGGPATSVLGASGSSTDVLGGFQVDVPEGYYYTLDPYDRNIERPAGFTSLGVPIPGFLARLPTGAGGAPTSGGGASSGPFGGYAGSDQQLADRATKVVRLDLALPTGKTVQASVTESAADTLIREIEGAQRSAGGA